MFGQSNDLFYAPGQNGIALFQNGQPVSGDMTAQLSLWDAGTEMNQWPGAGPDQAPRQSGPNTGADDDNNLVRQVNDGYEYPALSSTIRLVITPLN